MTYIAACLARYLPGDREFPLKRNETHNGTLTGY
jgi:hypothetical protein